MLRLFRQLSSTGQERLIRQGSFEIEWEASHPSVSDQTEAHKK